MREDRVHELFFGCLQVHGDDIALDQFRHFCTDHVSAEQLAMLEKQFLERSLLEQNGLPRLSLFYLR